MIAKELPVHIHLDFGLPTQLPPHLVRGPWVSADPWVPTRHTESQMLEMRL